MQVLVTGAAGMLGHDLVPLLRARGHEVVAATRAELDITDDEQCRAMVRGSDLVINLAAWTAVDDAEAREAEAYAVNAAGAANLARAAAASGARMIQLSTDYVFDGTANEPYAEDAETAPRTAYGRTKVAGEQAVRRLCPQAQIVRTAWLYGAGGSNFVATMARLATERDTVTVVDDQRGQPTWTRDLARQLVALAAAPGAAGTFHGTASGSATWFDLARAVFAELRHDPERVQPTTSAAFVRPAPRPTYSVLGHDAWRAAGLTPQRDWRAALREAVPLLGLTPSSRADG